MDGKSLDIEITQGSTFELLIPINDVNGAPLDMTGYTGGTAGARSKIRKAYSDAAATCSFVAAILANAGILTAISNGQCHLTTADIAALEPDASGKCYILLTLSATATAAIPKGNYVWDCEIEDTYGFVFKPYRGAVTVLPEVTK